MKAFTLKYVFFTVIMSAFVTVGCASAFSDENLTRLATSLTKVSSSVHATVRYDRSADTLDEAELLDFSVSHKPSYLTPFEGFIVKVRRDGKYSSVLVCDEDGKEGLMEDAGCTGKMDEAMWQTMPEAACAFTLNLAEVCTAGN